MTIQEAITEQYRRRLRAIENRDNDLTILHNGIGGKLSPDVYMALRDTVHRCYQPIMDDATRLINALEELRDNQ